MRSHKCPAEGCQQPKAREMAFCRDHWMRLPRQMRENIWWAFRNSEWRAWEGAMKRAKDYLREGHHDLRH